MPTIDIKIQNRCDHRIPGERVLLASDGRTLLPQFPVANVGSLVVNRNGVDLAQNSYSVATNPSITGDFNYKKITLAIKDPSSSPFFEISYNTLSNYCPKCAGTNFTDDVTDNGSGDFSLISLSGQLAQVVEKVIVTKIGSNKYANWVGTNLHNLVGSKITNFALIANEIKTDIRTSLLNLQQYQIQWLQVNTQYADSAEVLGKILSIDVTQNSEDPTLVEVFVSYTARSGQVLGFTQILELSTLRVRG